MITVLLVIIYLAFISLGLPDAILGASWPVVHLEFGVDVGVAGFLSLVTTFGTVISSLTSSRVIARYGTGKVTSISVALTAAGLMGIAFAPNIYIIVLMTIPLGLGAGAIDTALNNFVALHYKPIHMSWLHCFWGVGASLGPVIMSCFLGVAGGWRKGYFIISAIQIILCIAMTLALPLWRVLEKEPTKQQEKAEPLKIKDVLKIPGTKFAMLAFFCYCSAELTAGMWGSSYFVQQKGATPEQAAQWVSFFYVGIMVGRFLSGFLTLKLQNKQILCMGAAIAICGGVALALPLPQVVQPVALLVVGLGFAPIFPAMIHNTPSLFGAENSQAVIGVQMASAYLGNTMLPPLFGAMASRVGFWIFPLFILLMLAVMSFTLLRLYRCIAKQEQ